MTKTPQTEAEETGRLAGLGTGILAGAQLGTALIPIPVVGTLGSRVGKQIAPSVVSVLDQVVEGVEQVVKPIFGQSTPAQPSATGKPDLVEALEQLGKLRSQGLLTEEEYTAAKARLLNR
jgi:phage tail tape-measure protein